MSELSASMLMSGERIAHPVPFEAGFWKGGDLTALSVALKRTPDQYCLILHHICVEESL